MSEERVIRINKVLRELNISLDRAIEHLADNKIHIDKSPNSKINNNEYELLLEKFSVDKQKREASQMVTIKDLEKKLNIKLTKVKNTDRGVPNTYSNNDKNQIIHLSLKTEQVDLKYIKGYSKLITLYLDTNIVTNGYIIGDLKYLEDLRIKSRETFNIGYLENLPNLQYLNLQAKIQNINPISNIESLKILILSDNFISDLEPLQNLTNLTRLVLSNNKIIDIRHLAGLANLKSLEIANNQIKSIEHLIDLGNLKMLGLARNSISNLSPIENLKELEFLDITNNPVSQINFPFPKKIKIFIMNDILSKNLILIDNLIHLEYLSAKNCQIEDISGISKLVNLTQVNLDHNLINEVINLSNLHKIQFLELSNNLIESLDGLKNLEQINTLNLSSNRISDINPIGELYALQHLILNENNIADISVIENLPNLEILEVDNNRLTNLDSLVKLPNNLKYFSILNNPIVENQGWKIVEDENHLSLIKNHLSFSKEKLYDYILPAKVLLLGNHASGKSTLLDYLMQSNPNKTIKEGTDTTHIIKIEKFPTTTIGNKLPEIIYFDFGGQDYYHGIYKAFLTNDALNLLLWNYKSDKNELRNDTRDFSRKYWLHQLKYYFEKNRTNDETEPILLIQTHADHQDSRRKTFNDDCENFDIINEFYISLNQKSVCSNNTLSASLKFLQSQIDDEIKKKRKNLPRPKWYGAFINYILSSQDENSTSIDEIKLNYTRSKKQNEEESDFNDFLKEDLDQLHKTGLILYYKNDISEIAWLNPTKTVQYIHDTILSKDRLKKCHGIVKKEDFNYDKNIIKLLRLQKVVFYDVAEKNYIIPNFLPLSTDSDNRYDIITFGLNKPDFSLKFANFLPFGLVNQLICHFGQNPDAKYFWRDQIIFTLNKEAKILIKLDFKSLYISVYFSFVTQNIKIREDIKNIYLVA